jgi:MoaA/NifB/PqqE/SkfB family radical SAM enzyme/SAM-dependent methyltransferase
MMNQQQSSKQLFKRIAMDGTIRKLHPRIIAFLKEYLEGEKAVEHNGKLVINTQFPPWPSKAFDRVIHQLSTGQPHSRLYSLTIAVTNRCPMHCWHCYNADRSQSDIPLNRFQELAKEVQSLGATVVTLTGGEPLLRKDLPSICASFDDRSAIVVGTSGVGLNIDMARRLAESGVWAVGISMDSDDEAEHDRRRGTKGAFSGAIKAVEAVHSASMYPYFVTVATRDLLEPERFWGFMEFSRRSGAREVHMLEPCLTGRLSGREDVTLSSTERNLILEYQRQVAQREELPVLSTFTYLEGPDAFGCGAGLTHLYIDGSGELSPCNLVPLSFGNISKEPLAVILDRMGVYFREPRPSCIGRILTKYAGDGPFPISKDESSKICQEHLPKEHDLPKFFAIRAAATATAGNQELQTAYDNVHREYDDFWSKEAGAPVIDLINRLALKGTEHVLEAGCGTGIGTIHLSGALAKGKILAVDLSANMLAVAEKRFGKNGLKNVALVQSNALEELRKARDLDLVFTSWVLGYIPLNPFFSVAINALKPGGKLALIVHRDRSPNREIELFDEIVMDDPSVLTKAISFDFPKDTGHLTEELEQARFHVRDIWEGQVIFRYDTAEDVLRHLLKSGAGTVFYEALDYRRRDDLKNDFLKRLIKRNKESTDYTVIHDYLACIAQRP